MAPPEPIHKSVPLRRATSHANSTPGHVSELVDIIVNHVEAPPDLLNCACVSGTWSIPALKKLYRGSMNDMRYRTPDIGSLNCLLVASRDRFVRNMSFVDHLTIAPAVTVREDSGEDHKPIGIEKCRALSRSEDAERLLKPMAKGPESLAVPLEISNQDISGIVHLVLQPNIKCLSINSAYCQMLWRSQGYLPSPSTLYELLGNLQALSIYRTTTDDFDDAHVSAILKHCDLKFFSAQNWMNSIDLLATESELILKRLRLHTNLKVLCFTVRELPPPLEWWGLDSPTGESPWSHLEALYLDEIGTSFLTKLTQFPKLRVLRFTRLASTDRDAVNVAAENIAKCASLQVLDITYFQTYSAAEPVLSIAKGCKNLQNLRIWGTQSRCKTMTDSQFLSLVQALPLLEMLTLSVPLAMSASTCLSDIAKHCPRLKGLDLDRTRLSVSFGCLEDVRPLRDLEFMRFQDIVFENALQIILEDRLQSLVRAWGVAFPRLRYMLHPNGFEKLWDVDQSYESARRRGAQRSPPGESTGIYTFALKVKLWKSLGYDRLNFRLDDPHYLWQTDFEIREFGWPVVPLDAFRSPACFSSSTC